MKAARPKTKPKPKPTTRDQTTLTEKTPDHVRKIYRHLRSGEPHIRVRGQGEGPDDPGYSSSDEQRERRRRRRERMRRRRGRHRGDDWDSDDEFYSMYEEDDLARMPMWKSYLYHLQQQAPKPKKIVCQREVPNKPPFYGREFHGAMSREDADFLLTIGGEGSFLIRESQRATGQYTLALRFVDSTKNFKLYYDGQHYVGEKRFDNVQDLVADGLITFYLESKAADYIAALSNESNYAESPYVAYNTFKKRQLAHPSRRTRSRNERNRPVPAVVATTAAASSIPRSESESGRESGNSSSGSVGVATAAAAGASGLPPPPPQPQQQAPTPQLGIGAIPKTSRANIPVSSQFVEKRRSQAEASGQQVVTTTTAIATTAAAVETIPEDTGNYTSPIAATKKVTQPNPTYQQVMVISQAPTQPAVSSTPPVTATTDDVAAALEASAALAASQPYYQNCEQIALHQQLLLQQKEQLRLSQQIPPPPDEPPPRPPATATTTTVTSTAVVLSAASASVVTAAPSEMVTTTTAVVDNSGVSAVDGRVSHSTNTDGPPKPPLPTPLPAIRGKKPAPVTTTTAANIPVAMATGAAKPAPTKPAPTKPTPVASPVVPKLTTRPVSAVTPTSKPVTIATAATPRPASVATTTVVTAAPVQPRRKSPSRSPSPRARVRDSKKTHSFKMFENFAVSPPGSPPPPGIVGPGGDFKLSSVSWCTDYLEVMGCEKPHNFKLHTFKGPHWCDFCANFLWGLIAQGVKCQDCGLNAHKKCSERVPNDCMPDMKYVKRVFGIDLTTLVKAQNTLIPAVVELCVKEIESRGLDAEGLYRVAGFHDDVEAIKMSFDKDIETTDITEEGYDDINTITSVLKLYFRLLPIPLVTFEIYFRVIDTVRREDINLDIKLEKLKQMLAQLPPAHYHTLKYLMAHLFRVTEQQTKNMMNAENLSIVFAPTVLRSPETDPLSSLTAVKYERELIEMLINHHTTLFE